GSADRPFTEALGLEWEDDIEVAVAREQGLGDHRVGAAGKRAVPIADVTVGQRLRYTRSDIRLGESRKSSCAWIVGNYVTGVVDDGPILEPCEQTRVDPLVFAYLKELLARRRNGGCLLGETCGLLNSNLRRVEPVEDEICRGSIGRQLIRRIV